METATAPHPRPLVRYAPVTRPSRDVGWVVAIGATTVFLRLPFLTRPTGADEGGLLLIAAQWHPGTSLYGDYWVDRPPLLLDVFSLADRLGGIAALRVLGLGFVVVSVLLAGVVGRLVGGSPRVSALVAAALLVNPLLGVHEVDGELVALPFVLGAVTAALAAAKWPAGRRRAGLLVTAGAVAAAGVLIKQNEIDSLLFIAIGSLTFLARGGRWYTTLLVAGGGAAALATAVLLHAATLGTGQAALWDAVVTFRFDATRVINASATKSTSDRFRAMVLALVGSGAPLLLLAGARHLHRKPASGRLDLRWATLVVLAWELVSVVAGGSYWLHYLVCLVPAVVLVTATATAYDGPVRHTTRPVLAVAVGAVVMSAMVSMTATATSPRLQRVDPVITWLRAHDAAGQSGVVAFGHPDYLQASGLTSPYPELWSLPVRVRDPHLTDLRAVLVGPSRPQWVVTDDTGSLGSWGIDARAAQLVFEKHYRLAADLGSRRIYVHRTRPRSGAVQVQAPRFGP